MTREELQETIDQLQKTLKGKENTYLKLKREMTEIKAQINQALCNRNALNNVISEKLIAEEALKRCYRYGTHIPISLDHTDALTAWKIRNQFLSDMSTNDASTNDIRIVLEYIDKYILIPNNKK